MMPSKASNQNRPSGSRSGNFQPIKATFASFKAPSPVSNTRDIHTLSLSLSQSIGDPPKKNPRSHQSRRGGNIDLKLQ